MTSDYLHRLDEIITRYQLEPDLRDVYVEGPFDQRVFTWFLKNNNHTHSTTYEIDTINISAELLSNHGLENSNRGRIIALAIVTLKELGPEAMQVTCIADTDLEILSEPKFRLPNLLYTDFAALEGYFISTETIKQLLTLTCGHPPAIADKATSDIIEVTQTLFACRTINSNTGLSLKKISIKKSLTENKLRLSLDLDDLLKRYLNKNAKSSATITFKNSVIDMGKKNLARIHLALHGHDLIDVILFYVAETSSVGREFTTDSLRELFLHSTQPQSLQKHPLFASLLRRTCTANCLQH